MDARLFGWTIDEIHDLLGDDPSDGCLADAYAAVDSKVVMLMHEYAEDDSRAGEYALWCGYHTELYDQIILESSKIPGA